MFIVFNKQKIYSYIIALTTVIVLFCGATFFEQGKNIVSYKVVPAKWSGLMC